MQGELTSLLFMNVYRIYIYLVCFSSLLCWWIDKKGRRIERVYICMFNIFVYAYMFMFVQHFVYVLFLNIFIRFCYAWVKGELLWSISLIHAYITSWVLSSSKRGRLLAQKLITLVLMMINSCNYSTKVFI